MPMKRQRTPQEKKRLSLKKDRRNTYGENDKGARKTIPKHKRLSIRSIRRAGSAGLKEDPDRADAKRLQRIRIRWRKAADAPLGRVVEEHLEARKGRTCRKVRARQARDRQ